jgi:hypothetical protein
MLSRLLFCFLRTSSGRRTIHSGPAVNNLISGSSLGCFLGSEDTVWNTLRFRSSELACKWFVLSYRTRCCQAPGFGCIWLRKANRTNTAFWSVLFSRQCHFAFQLFFGIFRFLYYQKQYFRTIERDIESHLWLSSIFYFHLYYSIFKKWPKAH